MSEGNQSSSAPASHLDTQFQWSDEPTIGVVLVRKRWARRDGGRREKNLARQNISSLRVTRARRTDPSPPSWPSLAQEPQRANVMDRDLEIDRDMEHESDTDYPLINKRYLNKQTFQLTQKQSTRFVAPKG